jgi:hypothetical protein
MIAKTVTVAIALVVAAVSCAAPQGDADDADRIGEPTGPGNEPVEEAEDSASTSDALTCGSLSVTISGVSTKCACGDYSLPCAATQSVNQGRFCNKAKKRICTVVDQRSVSVSGSRTLTSWTAWKRYWRNCDRFC